MGKSILDAGWGGFLTRLEAVAVKRGILVVKVSAYRTTQECSTCGAIVPKDLSVRTHECPKCNTVLDRDENAAINVLNRALDEAGIVLSAPVAHGGNHGSYFTWGDPKTLRVSLSETLRVRQLLHLGRPLSWCASSCARRWREVAPQDRTALTALPPKTALPPQDRAGLPVEA